MAFQVGTTSQGTNAFLGGSGQRKVQQLCDGSLLVTFHDGSNWIGDIISTPKGTPSVAAISGWPTKSATAAVPDVFVLNNGTTTSDVWVCETQTNTGVSHAVYTASGQSWAWDATTQIAGSSNASFWPQIVWTGTNLIVAIQDKPGGTNYVTTVFWTTTKNGTAGWSTAISGFESTSPTATRYNRPLLIHDVTAACTVMFYSDAASSPYAVRGRVLSDAFTPALANWGSQVDLGLSIDLDAVGGGIGVGSNSYDDMNGFQAIIDGGNKRYHLVVSNGPAGSTHDPYYLNGIITVDAVTVANNTLTVANTITVDTVNTNTMVAIGIDGSGQVWIFWGHEPSGTQGDIYYSTSVAPYTSATAGTNLTNNLSGNCQATHIPQDVVLSGAIPVIYATGSANPWTVWMDTTLTALSGSTTVMDRYPMPWARLPL